LKAYIELVTKGARRAIVDIASIKAIFTAAGQDIGTMASPDEPLTILLNDGTEFEVFGISAEAIMQQLQAYGRIDGCLWLPR